MQKGKTYFDTSLLTYIILIIIFSCIALQSAQKYAPGDINFLKKQIIWFIISGVLILIIFYFDFDSIMKLTPYIYSLGILLLIFVLLAPDSIAPEIKGAKSWILVPGLGSMQPSEFMKIFLILMLSYRATKHSEKYTTGVIGSDIKLLLQMGIIAGLPMGLTLLQNDFGTTLVMFIISLGIIFTAGINYKLVISVVITLTIIVFLLIITFLYDPNILLNLLDPYQLDRINSWLDPFGHAQGIGYQLKQSIVAIGSGTMYGKGYDMSNVYTPETHTDFIFTIVGEELGFLGGSLLIVLYFLIIYRTIRIALYSNFFESFICTGIISLLTFHVFQNIGMVIGLIPITGIPLPLMSYGGSSVMSTMIGLGLILNISLKKKQYMFSKDD